MRRLAWTFAARIGDKYQIRLTRLIYAAIVSLLMVQIDVYKIKKYVVQALEQTYESIDKWQIRMIFWWIDMDPKWKGIKRCLGKVSITW